MKTSVNHTASGIFTGLFVSVSVAVQTVHDLDGARRLLQLHAVQVVYADGG